MGIRRVAALSVMLSAYLLTLSFSSQADAPTAEGPIILKQGVYKGSWVDRKYSGDLVLNLVDNQATVRFDHADKSCLGDKKFAATFKDDDSVEIANPFVVDVGGRCGVFDVTLTRDGETLEFYFHRRKYVNTPFTGSVVIPR